MKIYKYSFKVVKYILSRYLNNFDETFKDISDQDVLIIHLENDKISIYIENKLITESLVDATIVYDFKGLGKKYSAARIIKNMPTNGYIILSDNEDPKIGICNTDILGSKMMVIGCFGNWSEAINVDQDFDIDYIVTKIIEYESSHSFPNPKDMYIQVPYDMTGSVPSKLWELNYIISI